MIKKSFKALLYLIATFLILIQPSYALNLVELSPGYYPNTSRGRALSSADIYVGKPDLDPEIVVNQKTLSVQQEDGTIVAVTQPVSTSAGGVPQYAGSPVTLLVEGDYSLKVLDSSGVQIYYVPSTAYEQYLVAGNYYYPDYTEADQGVVGGGETVTDILTDVGAVTNATMYFSHNSGAATTTYTFTTNTTISDNYNIIVEEGVILNGAGTLTINSPFSVGPYQIFGSSITVAGNPICEAILVDWWATGDSTTNDYLALQACLDFFELARGKLVFTQGKTYLTNTALTFDLAANSVDGLFIEGYGATLKSGLGTGYILNITNTNDVQFRNWGIQGLQFYGGASDTGQLLINAGTTGDFYNFTLQDLSLENVYGHGTRLTGNCFECQIANARILGNAANTTGKMLWLDETTGNISSVEIYNPSIRYGEYGLYADSGDVDIFGGTYLNAQKEGVYLKNGVGHGVYGLHVENNYAGAADFAAGGAGIYLEGRWNAYGCYGVCGVTGKQQWVIDIYSLYAANIFGGHYSDTGAQGVDYVRIKNATDGNINIIGIFADDINLASVTHGGTDVKIHGRVEETITVDSSTLRWFGTSVLDSTDNKVDCTLPDGHTIGAIKVIVMSEASNSSIITVTSHDDVTGLPLATGISGDGETGTFDAVDETWILMWTGTEWTTLRATCTFV